MKTRLKKLFSPRLPLSKHIKKFRVRKILTFEFKKDFQKRKKEKFLKKILKKDVKIENFLKYFENLRMLQKISEKFQKKSK